MALCSSLVAKDFSRRRQLLSSVDVKCTLSTRQIRANPCSWGFVGRVPIASRVGWAVARLVTVLRGAMGGQSATPACYTFDDVFASQTHSKVARPGGLALAGPDTARLTACACSCGCRLRFPAQCAAPQTARGPSISPSRSACVTLSSQRLWRAWSRDH